MRFREPHSVHRRRQRVPAHRRGTPRPLTEPDWIVRADYRSARVLFVGERPPRSPRRPIRAALETAGAYRGVGQKRGRTPRVAWEHVAEFAARGTGPLPGNGTVASGQEEQLKGRDRTWSTRQSCAARCAAPSTRSTPATTERWLTDSELRSSTSSTASTPSAVGVSQRRP